MRKRPRPQSLAPFAGSSNGDGSIQISPGLATRSSGLPLVSLSKTVVECQGSTNDQNEDKRGRSSSLSSKTSTFFDIQSFPSNFELSRPRNEFEQEFDIQRHSTPPATSRIDLGDSQGPPVPRKLTGSFTAPPELVMSLRKYSDEVTQSPSQSLASRVLHFGFGLVDGVRGDGAALSEHNGSRGGGESGNGECRELLVGSATSSASDGSGLSSVEQETARAARDAMDTPLGTPLPQQPSQNQKQRQRRPVQLLGRKDDIPKALTTTIASELRAVLPVQQRLAKTWRLVYSMDQHGISMNTMLQQCESEKALLLAIKDNNGRVFGAFLNETLRLSPTFYGQGTSFLWKAFRSSPESRKKDAVRCFRYTGENEYFILCDPDFVAIGGGRGKFGLWFKGDFLHGYSARCPTFNNEPLCLDPSHLRNKDPDAQQEFVVSHLELWAFDS
ncbi:oxidation resistance protein 1 [Coemansia sp. RSA 988]|nr:oxidation resistance protein 1 [Coemansia sp. RSA 988]